MTSQKPTGRPSVYKSTFVEVLALIAISSSSMLNAASQGALQLALPEIGRHFDIDSQRLTWVMSSFSLTSGSMLLFLASLSDIFGRKKILVFSYAWFAIWSLASGFVQSDIALDICRAICGMGSAGAVPAAVGILGNIYKPGTRQNKAFACLSGANPLGFVWGIICGGIATQYLGWRANLFFMAIVFSGITVLAIFFVPSDESVLLHVKAGLDANEAPTQAPIPQTVADENGDNTTSTTPTQVEKPTMGMLLRKVDYLGAFLATAGFLLFIFALTESGDGWNKPHVISTLVIGIVLLLAFVGWEHYLGDRALMPLYIWTYPNFAILMVIIALGWMNFAGILNLNNTLWFQDIDKVSPLETTARFLPMAIVGILVNVFAAYTLHIISGKILLIIGMLSFTGAALLWALNQPGTIYWAMQFPALILCVVGADLVFMVIQVFVLKAVPHELKSTSGGVLASVVLLGQSAGYGGGAAVQGSVLRSTPTPDEGTVVKAFHAAYWFAVGCTAFGTILCLFVKVGRQGHKKDTDKDVLPDIPKEKNSASISDDISDAEEGRNPGPADASKADNEAITGVSAKNTAKSYS